MLSLISLGRGLWQTFQTTHPVIRWGGAILLGLIVLEFIGQEAISLYVHMQTARATIERTNADATTAAMNAWRQCILTLADPNKDEACDKYHPYPEVHAREREAERARQAQRAAECGANEAYVMGACRPRVQ